VPLRLVPDEARPVVFFAVLFVDPLLVERARVEAEVLFLAAVLLFAGLFVAVLLFLAAVDLFAVVVLDFEREEAAFLERLEVPLRLPQRARAAFLAAALLDIFLPVLFEVERLEELRRPLVDPEDFLPWSRAIFPPD
jgi:hypothetical protein